MTMLHGHHSERYHHEGYTLLRQAMPLSIARSLGERAVGMAQAGRGTHRTEDGRRHTILDGADVAELLPVLYGFYLGLPVAVAPIVCRPIILSPYSRSAVNVKVYPVGGTHEGHYDTNAVTALLFLSAGGGPTVITTLTGRVDALDNYQPGDLLLMQGRRCWHEVPPAAQTRVTAPLNLYHPDDIRRPSNTDTKVYG